jgi:hypothetical protein
MGPPVMRQSWLAARALCKPVFRRSGQRCVHAQAQALRRQQVTPLTYQLTIGSPRGGSAVLIIEDKTVRAPRFSPKAVSQSTWSVRFTR